MWVLGGPDTTQMPGQPHSYKQEGKDRERGSHHPSPLGLSGQLAEATWADAEWRDTGQALIMLKANTSRSEANAG